MKILYIAPTDPRETSYGGQQRTHAIWRGLCSLPGAEVSVFVPVPHRKMEKQEPDVGIYRLCLERRNHPGWFLQRILKRFIPYCDYSFAYNWKDLKTHFPNVDAIVVRYMAFAAAFKVWHLAPFYLDADDIHTVEFDLETKVVGNSWMRRIKRAVLEYIQYGVYRRSTRIFIPAVEHLSILKGYPVACLPNIPHPPLPDVTATSGRKNRLLFIGLMGHAPNYLALDGFFSRHWGTLKDMFPDLEFHVIGGGLPTGYREKWKNYADVVVRGFVENLHVEFAQSLALVTPMLMGMGSCIKVLEALRMGRPVIATPQGFRGIRQEDRIPQNGLFEYTEERTLVSAIQTLRNQDESERQKMAARAVQFVETHFSQSVVTRVLLDNIYDKQNYCS